MSRRRAYLREYASEDSKRVVYSTAVPEKRIVRSVSLSREIEDLQYERKIGPPKIRVDFPGPSAFTIRVNPPWTGSSFTVRNRFVRREVKTLDYSWVEEQRRKEATLPEPQSSKARKPVLPFVAFYSCGHSREGKAYDEPDAAAIIKSLQEMECPTCTNDKIDELERQRKAEAAAATYSDKWRKD